MYAKVVPWERQYPIEDFSSPYIDAANVGFLIREGLPLDAGRLSETRWQRVAITSERPLTVYRNLAVLPRYRLVTEVRSASNMDEARKLLPTVDPRTTAIAECPAALVASNHQGLGRVAVRRYAPEQVELLVETDRPAFLVAAEGYAPGWTATVDNTPQTVCPADVAFMGFPVAAGRHVVNLEYFPRSLTWWAALSAISWSALALWMLVVARRESAARRTTFRDEARA